MTQATIANLMTGGMQALSADYGLPMLSRAMPEAPEPMAAAGLPVEIGPGERFAISSGLAVVPVRGILTPNAEILERFLGWATYHGLARTFGELEANDDVRGVALVLDTPGGSVIGMQAAVAALRALAAQKPVHALVNPLAASAGYWLASQASEIAVTPGAMVGSVGVLATSQVPLQPGMSGFQTFLTTSAHAGAKVADPSTEEGRALVQAQIDEIEALFLDDIAAGRGIDREALPGQLSRDGDPAHGGGTFWGQDAVTRGLADRVEGEAAFFDRMFASVAQAAPRRPTRGARARALAAQALSNS